MPAPSLASQVLQLVSEISWPVWLAIFLTSLFLFGTFAYAVVFAVAPIPRKPHASEHTYKTTDATGKAFSKLRLPCWHDSYLQSSGADTQKTVTVTVQELEPAEIFLSVVVPAYNEEKRLPKMLDEACDYLESEYGAGALMPKRKNGQPAANGNRASSKARKGWEILVVSDGSIDRTEDVALSYSKRHPGGSIRVITLEHNRGKGGAVTHGLRHVRGEYAIFADADGASHFPDAAALVAACEAKADAHGRCVAVGSRAHMVSTDAVVKRSALRNFLMHGFHLLLWLMTPQATSQIKDTQCGFKMFSRPALPYIVPHMHSEGWIFDVEMLMLAESAGVPMVEVPITWREVQGSKLNVVWDSLGMAWGLAILRAAWALGVYRVR